MECNNFVFGYSLFSWGHPDRGLRIEDWGLRPEDRGPKTEDWGMRLASLLINSSIFSFPKLRWGWKNFYFDRVASDLSKNRAATLLLDFSNRQLMQTTSFICLLYFAPVASHLSKNRVATLASSSYEIFRLAADAKDFFSLWKRKFFQRRKKVRTNFFGTVCRQYIRNGFQDAFYEPNVQHI